MELKDQLEALSTSLHGKITDETKTMIDKIVEETKSATSAEIKTVQDAFELKLKAMQEHADKLDVKLQERAQVQTKDADPLEEMISKNFDRIKDVRKGHSVNIELKAVGNMTLTASLTGDQPRQYSEIVQSVPSQMPNFSDLVIPIPITGGTYTFPRETGSEGGITTQTEGSDKSQIDYDLTMVDVNTDFLAGFCVYSKKMANNLPFLENFLPMALRRDYWKAENAQFYTELAAAATASTLTAGNIVARMISEQTTLMALNYMPNGIVISPADYGKILVTAGPDGSGTDAAYSLPGAVTYANGMLTINGLKVYVASWCPADKYIIGDWSYANKVITQGLGVEFFEQDSDNVRKNNITARVESQIALAVGRPDAFIAGDWTTIA